MISSFLKGSTGALILTFALLFIILPTISGIMSIANFDPYFILTYQGNTVYYTLDENLAKDMGFSLEPWLAAGVMSIYAIVCSTIGYLLFRKREMVS
jgi:ABC-type transport system involved in multi-copper enzyme maturation permease subunit